MSTNMAENKDLAGISSTNLDLFQPENADDDQRVYTDVDRNEHDVMDEATPLIGQGSLSHTIGVVDYSGRYAEENEH